MFEALSNDSKNMKSILEAACNIAVGELQALPQKFVAPGFPASPLAPLPADGAGADAAIKLFMEKYAPYLYAMPGPNFFGFVIGGTTPAALAGDWLTSAFDQNAFGLPGNADRHIECEAIAMARELIGLPDTFEGVMASGATMATLTALAAAREWAAERQGVDAAQDGVSALDLKFYSGTAHASVYKALSILGLGRGSMVRSGLLPGREAVDTGALERLLKARKGLSVVIASMCAVDSGDYDDLAELARLRKKYGFWLHIDGAIAAPAAALPEFAGRFAGMAEADSVTLDCHKWFNTPYDGAIALCRHPQYQYRAFAQSPKANDMPAETPFFNLAPEGSRRLRALPLWMSLTAYGKNGYADIFRRNCAHARLAHDLLVKSGKVRLLAEPKFNIVCFTTKTGDKESVKKLAADIQATGKTFANMTWYRGETPAIRLCFSNWSTQDENVAAGVEAILNCL